MVIRAVTPTQPHDEIRDRGVRFELSAAWRSRRARYVGQLLAKLFFKNHVILSFFSAAFAAFAAFPAAAVCSASLRLRVSHPISAGDTR